MDTRRIRKLIELVKETGVGELEVKSGEDSVRISRYSAPQAAVQPTVLQQPVVSEQSAVQASASVNSAEAGVAEVAAQDQGHVQKSPMVGTVYLASTPGSKPFVAVGDRVEEGDPLCLIEAMKMFNKIEAECAGVVSARLVENEQPVEYDQPLFIIEPNE